MDVAAPLEEWTQQSLLTEGLFSLECLCWTIGNQVCKPVYLLFCENLSCWSQGRFFAIKPTFAELSR